MKTKWIASVIPVLFVHLFQNLSAAGHEASELLRYNDENTGLTILRAKVSLPAPGYWTPVPVEAAAAGLREVFLNVANEDDHTLLSGRRMSRRAELKEIASAQWPLNQLSWTIPSFAEQNDGRSPKSLDEMDEKLGAVNRRKFTESYHVFEDRLTINRDLAPGDARIVAFETTPAVADGKHWVLLSNGTTERRDIQPELAATPGVTIKARRPATLPEVKAVEYALLARVMDEKPATIRLKNILTDETSDIRIDPAKATVGEREVLGEWARMRMWSLPLDGEDSSAILPHWFRQAPALYGINPEDLGVVAGFSGRRERGRNTTIFNVFGGRAAISETLQMQDIAAPQAPVTNGGELTPISDIEGVVVKSHDYEEMLGAQDGGRIALAEVIPADRFFAYFPKPAGLISWLDGGAEFLFNAGSSTTGRSLQYGLGTRYTAALGMERDWMRRLLDSGAVEEIAIALPDLFLIEGTEVTVVARLKNPVVAAGLLKLIGINNLDTTTVRKGSDGSSSHWARRGDLLVISTHAGELERVLELEAAKGKGSLGQSAELRYMLTKLPLSDSTKAFVYLSDPFIRRLVGPETKIPQHRRIRARGEMEALVAGSLLYQFDGNQGGTAADLLAKQYVSTPRIATDAVLDPSSGAVSKTFGPLPRMHSLMDLDITTATAEEAAAYRGYLDNYNRFWSRFFDPIAIRIDQPEPAAYELSIFILPLIDNSIYNSLREIISDWEGASVLSIPVIEPEPVATLSMNLSEQVWVEGGGDMLENFAARAGLDTTILDFLGPDLHLSLADADPILEMGSGELTHVFGSMSGGNDMMMISTIISIFTRPTAISIGLSDAEAVRRALDGSVGRGTELAGRDVTGSLHKIAGRDGWIYRINFFDMMTLRLGIDVQDRFLVIRNMPLTSGFRITGVKDATQPGAQLTVSPRACRLQLPALFASAAERERAAAFSGISDLYPLLVTGKGSIREAAETHKAWFGFRPVHPGDGAWAWDGEEMRSNRYGTGAQPTQPDHAAGNRDFGILRKVDGGEVGMRFEDDGLRTTLRWQLRAVDM